MHESILARSASPAPAVVLGLLLKPFSLGHDLRLAKTNNPLFDSDKAESYHLSAAVLICSQTWRECERMPWDPFIGWKLKIWARRMAGLDFKTELAKFIHYRNEGSLEFPPSQVRDPGAQRSTRVLGSPLVLRLHQFMMINFRLTEEEAWDYPLGLAKCRWGCYWEEQGDWGIYNELEADFDQFVAKQETAKRAKGAKGAARV